MMSERLQRIVYASRLAPELGSEAVADIARISDARNRALDVTGYLSFGQGRVLQCIEGPPERIGSLSGRIFADRRHSDARVLGCETTGARRFGAWGMGYQSSTRIQRRALRELTGGEGFEPFA